MTRLRILIVSLAVPAVAVIVAWFWLLHTDSGASFLWRQAQAALGGAMRADRIAGNLGSGFDVAGFRLEHESVVVAMQSASITVDVDLLPLSIELSSARARSGSVRLSAASDEPREAADPAEALERLSLPIRVAFPDLEVTDVVVAGLPGERELVVQELSLSGQWADVIEIERLSVETPEASAQLQSALALARPFETALQLRVTAMPAISGYPEPIDVLMDVSGDLESASVNASTAPLELAVRGNLAGVLASPSWDLVAKTSQLAWPAADSAEVRLTDAQLGSRGSISGFSLDFDGVAEAAGFAPARISLDANGTVGDLEVSSLKVSSSELVLEGDGSIAWIDALSVASNLRLERADLHALTAAWPAAHPLRGSLSFIMDEQRVSISNTRLAVTGTDIQLGVEGDFALADGAVSGVLEWQQLRWPITGEATVSSQQGRVGVAGTTDDWQLEGRVNLATQGVGGGAFVVQGTGDQNNAAFEILDGSLLGGSISGNASFSREGEQPWAASLDISGVDPGSVLKAWPGNISGRVDASGQVTPFAVSITVDELSGTLRDQPLSGRGSLEVAPGRVAAGDLYLQHGTSELRADGDLYAVDGLSVDASVEDTAVYVRDSAGSLNVKGTVSLHTERPSARIAASSGRLRIGPVELFDLAVIDRNDGSDIVDLEVAAQQVIVARDSLDDVALRVEADKDRQAVELRSTYGRLSFDSRFAGNLDNWQDPSKWSGQLQSLAIFDKGEAVAQLTSPAGITFTRSGLAVESLCVADEGASLCTEVRWTADEYLALSMDLRSYPLDAVNLFTETGFRFDQLIDGRVNWRSGKPTGSARISISPGHITPVNDASARVRTETGQLSFDVVDGTLLAGTALFPMPGTGEIAGDFRLLDVAAGTASEIEGSLSVDMNDIAVLSVLSPLVDSMGGELDADLEFGGTLEAPLLVGDVAIRRGSIDYLPIGLRLDDVELEGSLPGNRRVELAGSFRAGDGRGTIETRADYRDGQSTGLQLELRGRDLAIINVPDVQAVANIDASVSYALDTLTLGGKIDVPRARIAPENLASNRVGVSEDVVIVAGELPGSVGPRARSALRMLGEMEVAIGDEVVVDLGVAKARISGSASLLWTGDPIPVANGRYDMTGNVAAFGQVLEISEGGIRFPNVPADNPQIRLRAVREIYGNSQVKLAGILVSGTARRPTIEAYTEPLTTEERAMTLLVTGSDFDLEQGVGAIDFGTYIAPRLFVSYGIGIFDRENVISARYDLNRGFGIKATSGQKESGVDVIYRFER